MACCYMFSENARSKLAMILAIVNWFCVVVSLVLMSIGVYIKLRVAEYTNLVKDYDGDTLPIMLITVGIFSAFNNYFGGFVTFFMANPLKRKSYRTFLFSYMVTSAVTSILIFAGAMLCFTHVKHLDSSFHGGILNAMKHYKTKMHLKVEVDQLQMFYSCCGNEGYADWFQIHWVNADVREPNMKHATDDVPFSCCSPHAHRPCINHHVQDNSRHINYDYTKRVTLHTSGCRETLMDFFGDVLVNSGIIIMAVFMFQIFLIVVSRLLYTAVETSLCNVDPLGPSPGYLWRPGACPSKEEGCADGLLRNYDLHGAGESGEIIYQNWAQSMHQGPMAQTSIHSQTSTIGTFKAPMIPGPPPPPPM